MSRFQDGISTFKRKKMAQNMTWRRDIFRLGWTSDYHCRIHNSGRSQQGTRKRISDHHAGRRLPDDDKPHFKALQISAMPGGSNRFFIMGLSNGVPCNMAIDTRANITIIRNELAQAMEGKLIWMPLCVTL